MKTIAQHAHADAHVCSFCHPGVGPGAGDEPRPDWSDSTGAPPPRAQSLALLGSFTWCVGTSSSSALQEDPWPPAAAAADHRSPRQ